MDREFTFTPLQEKIWLDVQKNNIRFPVLEFGIRNGKSFLLRCAVLMEEKRQIELNPGPSTRDYAIVAPTIPMARNIHWKNLKRMIPREWLAQKPNETRMEMLFKNGTEIGCYTGDDAEHLNGLTLHWAGVDETDQFKDDYIIDVLRARVGIGKGSMWMVGNPTPSGLVLKKLANFARSGKDKDWKAYRATTLDGGLFSEEELEKERLRLDPETFARQYEGTYTSSSGLVYPMFAEGIHVVEERDIKIPEEAPFIEVCDPGFNDPTAYALVAILPNDELVMVDEHYEAGKECDYHAGVIRAKRLKWNAENRIVDTLCDKGAIQQHSGAPSFKEQMAREGVYMRESQAAMSPHSVAPGIEVMRTYLKVKASGTPSLRIMSHCTNAIKEFKEYHYNPKRTTGEVIARGEDHIMDCLRYVVCERPNYFSAVRAVRGSSQTHYAKGVSYLNDSYAVA